MQILRQHSDSARQASECILHQPYNPEYWLQRAIHLLRLGFPELAAGDARKTALLCKAALSGDTSSLGGKVKLQFSTFVRSKGGERADNAEQGGLQDELLSKHIYAEKTLLDSLDMMGNF